MRSCPQHTHALVREATPCSHAKDPTHVHWRGLFYLHATLVHTRVCSPEKRQTNCTGVVLFPVSIGPGPQNLCLASRQLCAVNCARVRLTHRTEQKKSTMQTVFSILNNEKHFANRFFNTEQREALCKPFFQHCTCTWKQWEHFH